MTTKRRIYTLFIKDVLLLKDFGILFPFLYIYTHLNWFFQRNGTLENYELFLMYLNSIDANLKFTIEIGRNKLCFLDLKLTLKDHKSYYSLQQANQ